MPPAVSFLPHLLYRPQVIPCLPIGLEAKLTHAMAKLEVVSHQRDRAALLDFAAP